MNNVLRLACLVPALAILAMVLLAPTRPARHVARITAPADAQLRYVTLDRMLRGFAEQARAARATTRDTVLAAR